MTSEHWVRNSQVQDKIVRLCRYVNHNFASCERKMRTKSVIREVNALVRVKYSLSTNVVQTWETICCGWPCCCCSPQSRFAGRDLPPDNRCKTVAHLAGGFWPLRPRTCHSREGGNPDCCRRSAFRMMSDRAIRRPCISEKDTKSCCLGAE
jgi:hypothetical protein